MTILRHHVISHFIVGFFLCVLAECTNSTNSTMAISEKTFGSSKDQIIRVLFTGLGVVSLISLSIVFVVYWVITELNTLYGKVILSNVMSTSFVTIFLLLVYNIHNFDDYLCNILGYFGYFSTMTMFSWMTIISYHICSTLLGYLPGNITFLVYSVIGWGSGLVLTIVLFCLQNLLPTHSDFNPGIGDETCFIIPDGNKMLFLFHIPILIMMIINIVFFIIITIVNIVDPQKSLHSKSATRQELIIMEFEPMKTQDFQSKGLLLFHFKLINTVGLLWTMESVHFLIHNYYTQLCEENLGLYIFFRVIDSCNMLRGFFFFIIFVCNKNVWEKMKNFSVLKNKPRTHGEKTMQFQV